MTNTGRPASHDGREEREWFDALYRESREQLLGYLLRRTSEPDQAVDLLAEVYLIAWRRRADVPPGDQAVPWLFGVARNLLAADRRASVRERRLGERLRAELRTAAGADGPDGHGPRSASVATVERALARLKPGDRELLTLAGVEGLTPSRIAVALGVPAGVVRVRLHRSRRRLRQALELLEKEGGSEPATRAHGAWRCSAPMQREAKVSEATTGSGESARDRFRHLPEPVRPSDMVEEQQVSPPAPFDGGRDVAQDDALRAGG